MHPPPASRPQLQVGDAACVGISAPFVVRSWSGAFAVVEATTARLRRKRNGRPVDGCGSSSTWLVPMIAGQRVGVGVGARTLRKRS